MTTDYDDNVQYLNDSMAVIELLKTKALEGRGSEAKGDPASERSALAGMYSEIRDAGKRAFRRGVDLGLEKIVHKHKLDDVEAQILLILAFAAVHSDEDLNNIGKIKKMLQYLNDLDPATAISYWEEGGRLRRCKLFAPPKRWASRQELFINEATLDRILGRKTTGRNPSADRRLPVKLFADLGEFVVGQDHARRVIATTVFKHLQTCRLNKRRKGVNRLDKANILLIGATGTGKTHLCRTLAQILHVPFAMCNATQYTETGYVGANVEEMLVALREKSTGKQGARQGGIIFIDEIDKIASHDVGLSHNSTRDVSGLSVQQELLKLLDGERVQFEGVDYDVSNILFICGGAFAGLEENIGSRLKQRRIGFADAGGNDVRMDVPDMKAALPEDIIAYGFMPEFVGRFASIVALDGLGKNDLVDIMTKPRNSLLSQYQTLFKASGINLQIPQGALEWVADQALQNNTGARGLKSILEAHLSPILFEQSSATCGRRGQVPLKEVAFDPGLFDSTARAREA